MAIDERKIESIVAEVLDHLDRARARTTPGAASPLGIHPDLDTAIKTAPDGFAAFDRVSLETRNRIIASIREILLANLQTLAESAVEETGLGRVEDKIGKNLHPSTAAHARRPLPDRVMPRPRP